MTSKNKNLLNGSVKSHLLSLSWPMVFGILAVLSTSIVDTYFVGQLGTIELAALSFTFPIALAINSVSIGLGVGASSVISRALGSNDDKKAKRLATDALILSLTITSSLALTGFLTIDPLFTLIGAKKDVLDFISQYMQIWFLSLPILVVPMVGGSIIRAGGDSLWPGIQMVLSAIINILITPMLIFGYGPLPELGIRGAAYGTSIAWFFTLCFAIWLLTIKEKMLSFSFPKIKEVLSSWKDILYVGAPSALSQVVHPVAISVVTAIISKFGETAVAAYGVGTRIESLILVPLFALSAGIPPIAGQNWGAKKINRIKSVLSFSYKLSLFWGGLTFTLLFFFSNEISSLFSEVESVRLSAAAYIKIITLTLAGYGLVMCSSAVFNAIGKPLISFAYSFLRSVVLTIPLSALALNFNTLEYVFWAIAISNTISGIISSIYSRKRLKELES